MMPYLIRIPSSIFLVTPTKKVQIGHKPINSLTYTPNDSKKISKQMFNWAICKFITEHPHGSYHATINREQFSLPNRKSIDMIIYNPGQTKGDISLIVYYTVNRRSRVVYVCTNHQFRGHGTDPIAHDRVIIENMMVDGLKEMGVDGTSIAWHLEYND